jgi:hypothetical protein
MIEILITRLVHEAPTIDMAVVADLRAELERNGEPLARSISRVVELVADQLIDPGIALPALAMACATLVDARLDHAAREAARFEIETLLPMPDKPPRVTFVIPPTTLRRR